MFYLYTLCVCLKLAFIWLINRVIPINIFVPIIYVMVAAATATAAAGFPFRAGRIGICLGVYGVLMSLEIGF